MITSKLNKKITVGRYSITVVDWFDGISPVCPHAQSIQVTGPRPDEKSHSSDIATFPFPLPYLRVAAYKAIHG